MSNSEKQPTIDNSTQNKQNTLSSKKSGTRVFKKSTPNGKITVYIGKRDFYDHIEHCDPVDGVVLVDRDHIKDKVVYCHVLAAFRYGREDLDVLGLTFRKDLYIDRKQVYPPEIQEDEPLTRLQERLIKKLGRNAYPFKFTLPKGAPSSVTLQPAPGDTGKPCGVDYELRVYLSDTSDEKEYKKNSVRLAIRKITYAPKPENPQPPPMIETSKEFIMCPHPLLLEASLDKEMYYHGESIAVNVHVSNRSNKTVKKIKLTVRQYADICLFSTAQYKCPVATVETEEGFPVGQSGTLSKVIQITPLLANNKDKRGLALDGQLKHEDTNLASSTIMDCSTKKESLGIIVHYKVKIRLFVTGIGNDLAVELPFTLTHSKPPSPCPSPIVQRRYSEITQEQSSEQPPIDSDLINFDTDGPERQVNDDDLIFEEFARMRVRGEHQGETHA